MHTIINIPNLKNIQVELKKYIFSEVELEERSSVIPIFLYKDLLNDCILFNEWLKSCDYSVEHMSVLVNKNNSVSIHVIESDVFYIPLSGCEGGVHEFFIPTGKSNFGIQENGLTYIWYDINDCSLDSSVSLDTPIIRKKNVLSRQHSSIQPINYLLMFSVRGSK